MSDKQSSDRQIALDFDIQKIDQAFLDDPFPTYKLLRENDPVHLNPNGTYFLSRYDDVVQSFRHPAMSSDKKIDFKPKFGEGPLYIWEDSLLRVFSTLAGLGADTSRRLGADGYTGGISAPPVALSSVTPKR